MFNVPNVTERKSAPLPERSFERITCCTTLNVAYAGNCSAIGTQSECADHRRHCTPERQNISLKNDRTPGGQKAKNPAGGSEEGIFSGFKVMIKKSCSGMKEKGRLSPASGDYAAASSELNSMCIRSYGRMILFSSRLST
ncbi:host cell division inhibitor Icd-like protein, partial [Salmonella enterica subsp. enterica serovar Ball]|nr:host cell division inhibitor Icd-like protein [Salmonella enterica subsp. enterica serovar Ball]